MYVTCTHVHRMFSLVHSARSKGTKSSLKLLIYFSTIPRTSNSYLSRKLVFSCQYLHQSESIEAGDSRDIHGKVVTIWCCWSRSQEASCDVMALVHSLACHGAAVAAYQSVTAPTATVHSIQNLPLTGFLFTSHQFLEALISVGEFFLRRVKQKGSP